jgi:SAM-dependent methyltransferase
MESSFPCPACLSVDWEVIRTHQFARPDDVENELGAGSEYVALRRRVLYEIWFPNAHRVALDSIMCRGCGFITYAPRPTETDMENKYRFLMSEEGPRAQFRSAKHGASDEDRRAKRVYDKIACHKNDGSFTVLDFGGGDGRLLKPFVERGHLCSLVDLTLEPLPGIRKIGATLDDIPADQKYDVVICSHVLEHLAAPGRIVRGLAGHLATGGVFYGEVPAEICTGTSIGRDPVTHINYFNRASLEALVVRQGLTPKEVSRTTATVYGARRDVLVIIASSGGPSDNKSFAFGVDETRRLLNPSIEMKLGRYWRLRKLPTIAGVVRRLKGVFSR